MLKTDDANIEKEIVETAMTAAGGVVTQILANEEFSGILEERGKILTGNKTDSPKPGYPLLLTNHRRWGLKKKFSGTTYAMLTLKSKQGLNSNDLLHLLITIFFK